MSLHLKVIALIVLSIAQVSCGDSTSPFVGSGGNTGGGGGGGGGAGGNPQGPNNLSNVQLKTAFLTAEANGHARNVLQSSDGNTIIFSAEFDNGNNPDNIEQIFSIVGSSVTQITSFTLASPGLDPGSSGAPYTNLVLSADGSQIAWINSLDPTGNNAALNRAVFTIKTDGTQLRQLANTSVQHLNAEPPAISSDGSTVYFASNANLIANGNANMQIFSVSTDGINTLTQETSNTIGTSVGWIDVSSTGLIAFSGAGDWLGDSSNTDGGSDIYSIQANGAGGTGLTIYTNTSGADNYGKIIISGNIITFVTDRDPTGGNTDNSLELYSIDITGPTVTQLTSDWPTAVYNSEAGMPASGRDMFDMSTDGSRIVFVETIPATGLTPANYQARISSINPDGTGLSTIVETEADTLTLTEYISYPSANLTANITAFYSNINFQKQLSSQSLMQVYTASQ